jgi:hypothetical protein
MRTTSIVSITVDETDPRDPTARCDRCGTQGTIARAMRHTEPPLILRYCGPCWPEAQRELEARQRQEHEELRDTPGWSSSSRSWHDVGCFISKIEEFASTRGAPATAQFSAIAADIREKASEMEGPMPADVEDFLRKYTPPSP